MLCVLRKHCNEPNGMGCKMPECNQNGVSMHMNANEWAAKCIHACLEVAHKFLELWRLGALPGVAVQPGVFGVVMLRHRHGLEAKQNFHFYSGFSRWPWFAPGRADSRPKSRLARKTDLRGGWVPLVR